MFSERVFILVKLQMADKIVVIDGGKVIAEGTSAELKSKIGNDRLELTFKNAAALIKANQTLGKLVVDTNEKELTSSVIIKDSNLDVAKALDLLGKAKVYIQSM